MMRATYRRVAEWLKKTIFGRRRSTAKRLERVIYLTLLPLEERVVMTANLWMPQSINPLNGINQNIPTLQVFQPAGDSLLPPVGLSTGSDSWHSNISVLADGAYNLTLAETGPLGADTFFFHEAGSLQYSLTEQGSYSTSGYALPSVVLSQSGTLDWSLLVLDSSGHTVTSESGSDRVTTGSLGTAVIDPFFAEGFNWSDPTQRLILDNDLPIAGASAFSVSESGTQSYTLSNTGGHETITGTGAQPLPDMLQSNLQSFNYALNSSFTYTKQGAGTFTLAEQGSGGPGSYALTSVAYAESGSNSFALNEAGTAVESGTSHQTLSQQIGGGSNSLGDSTSESFQFTDTQSYSYAESGSQSYSLSQSGTFGHGSFALNSLHYNATGSGGYTLSVNGTNHAAGTFVQSLTTTGNDSSGAFTINRETARGSFTANSTLSRSEAGDGSLTLSARGSYSAGCWNFGTFTLADSAGSTFSSERTEAQHTTVSQGTFTDTGAGVTGNFTVNGSFTAQSDSTDTVAQSGTSSWSLSEIGAAQGGSYSLSCYVNRSTSSGTFSLTSATTSAESGTDAGVETSTTPHNGSNAGYTSTYGTSHDSFSGSTSTSGSAGGALSQTLYTAGSYANASYALSSVAYQAGGSDSWSQTGSDRTRSSGNADITQTVVKQGSNSGSGAESNSTATQHSLSTYQSFAGDTWSGSGTDSSSLTQKGTFAHDSYALSSISYNAAGSSTASIASAGTDSTALSGSVTSSTWTNEGNIGPYGPAGTSTLQGIGSFTSVSNSNFKQQLNDSWSLSSTSAGSYSLYEAGSYSSGSYSLSSVAYKQNGGDSWSSTETDTSTGSGTDSSTAKGLGCITDEHSHAVIASGSYQQTSSDTWTSSSSDTFNQSGTDSGTLSQIGTYSGDTFSFDSVVFRQSGTQSGASWSAGQSASTGTTQTQFTSQDNQATSAGTTTPGLTSATQTGLSKSYPTSTESFSANGSATTSWTSYQAGSLGSGGYALSSVNYNETDSNSSHFKDVQNSTNSGTDSWTGHTYTNVNQVTSNSNAVTTITGVVDASSKVSDRYKGSGSSTTIQDSSDSSTLSALGCYSHGSYAYTTMTYRANAHASGTITNTANSSYSGTGSDSTVSWGNRIFSSSQGLSVSSSSYADSSSSDSYQNGGTLSSSETERFSSRQTLYEQGSFALNSWNLSSVNYVAGSTASDAQNQTSTSSLNGQFTSSSYFNNWSESIGSGVTSTFDTTTRQDANGTFNSNSIGTLTQGGKAWEDWTGQGSYQSASGYSYSSVVFEAASISSGTLQTRTKSATTTYSRGSTNSTSNTTGKLSANGGVSSNTSDSQTGAETTGYQSGVSLTSLTEAIAAQQSSYEAGRCTSEGSYSFSSVTFFSASSDSATVLQTSKVNESGTVATTSTLNSESSYTNPVLFGGAAVGCSTGDSSSDSTSSINSTFRQTSVITYTQQQSSASTVSERGSYAGGSYAFSSLSYRYQANSFSTYLEGDVGSFTANSHSSFEGDSDGKSSSLITTITQSPPSTLTAFNSSVNGSEASSTSSVTQSGNDSTSVFDSQTSRYKVYEAGTSSPPSAGTAGTLSLSSVVLKQSSTETTITFAGYTGTSKGTIDSLTSASNGATSSTTLKTGGGVSKSNNSFTAYGDQTSTLSFTQCETMTSRTSAGSTSSLYEAGTGNGEVFSYSSVVYHAGQGSSQQVYLTSTQTASGSTYSTNGGTVTAQGTGGDQRQRYSRAQNLVSTTTLSELTGGTSHYDAYGSYDGSKEVYTLGTVSYQASAGDSHTAMQSSTATLSANTFSVQSSQLSAGPSSAATEVYSESYLDQNTRQRQTQKGSSSESLNEQGSYRNGNFDFSNVTWQQSSSSATYTKQTVNSNQTQVNATSVSSTFNLATLLITNNAQNTVTTYQQSTAVNKDYRGDTFSYFAHGTYNSTNGQVTLDSLTFNDKAWEYTSSKQTAVNTQVTDQSLQSSSTANGGATLKDNSLATISSNLSSTFTGYSLATLHEEGKLSAGSFSLSCIVYDGTGENTYNQKQIQTQNSKETCTATGNQALMGSQISIVVGVGNQGTAVSVGCATNTTNSNGTYTYNDHEEGTYAGGSFALASLSWSETAAGWQSVNAQSKPSSLATVTGPQIKLTQKHLANDSLQSTSQYSVTLKAKGSYSNGSWSLSSYALTATSTLASLQTQSSYGYAKSSGTNSAGYTWVANSTSWICQTMTQGQQNKLTEKGSYANGCFTLSQVSLTASGQNSFHYSMGNTSVKISHSAGYSTIVWNGVGGGNPITSISGGATNITADANSSYTVSSQGSYAGGVLTLTNFKLDGGSRGYYNMAQSGNTDADSWGQVDHYSANNSISEQGTYTSANGGSWTFGNYSSTLTTSEFKDDWSPANTACTTVNITYTTRGSGTSATQTITACATFQWNAREYWLVPNPTIKVSTVSITGPTIPAFNPSATPANWQVDPGSDTGSPPPPSMLNVLPVMPVSANAGPLPAPTIPGVGLPPRLAGVHSPLPPGGYTSPLIQLIAGMPKPNANWFTNQGAILVANALTQPWKWQKDLGENLFEAVGTAYNHIQTRKDNGVYSVTAKQIFYNVVTLVNAQVSNNWWADVGQIVDFVSGVLDYFTAGLFSSKAGGFAGWLGVGIDTTSNAYRYGQYAGQIIATIATILSLVNPASLPLAVLRFVRVIEVLQIGGAAYAAEQAIENRDWLGVFQAVAVAAGVGLRLFSQCGFSQLAGYAGTSILVGMGGFNVGSNLANAIGQFTDPYGDPVKGVLDLLTAGADAFALAKFIRSSCFTAEMLLDAEGGKKRADAIVEGDRLWSRNESDHTGPVQLKVVEKVFKLLASIWNVHVAGQILRTTAEHPFYVLGRGWIPTNMLRIGDVLLTRDGRLVPVEGVADNGVVETVYNFRVAEYHTYFVSATVDGVSVWAHNAYNVYVLTKRGKVVYVGITEQSPQARLGQHSTGPEAKPAGSFDRMRVIASDLANRTEARNIEGSALYHIAEGNISKGISQNGLLNAPRNDGGYWHGYRQGDPVRPIIPVDIITEYLDGVHGPKPPQSFPRP